MLKTVVIGVVLWAAAGALLASEAIPVLQVRGEAVLRVSADQARVDLALESSGRDAERVIAENNRRMQELVRRLDGAGVLSTERRTGAFSVTPQWSARPREADDSWQPTIVGYRVLNQLVLTTARLTRLPGWIQLAVEAGSNRIGQLQFTLADPEAHYRQALQQATRNAQAQAVAVAEAAGVVLGPIEQLQVDSNQPRPLQGVRLETMALRSSAPPPPLEAGEVEVQAAVAVRYRINP